MKISLFNLDLSKHFSHPCLYIDLNYSPLTKKLCLILLYMNSLLVKGNPSRSHIGMYIGS